MNIKRMKFIDETFGPLICFCFYWYNLFKKAILRPSLQIEPPKTKNILFIKFFGMGSILLAGPMFRALRVKFPAAKFMILTFSSNKELCLRTGFIDEVITTDPSSIFRFITSLLKAILYIRRKRYDISIDMEFFTKSSTLIQYLCGTKIRVGYYIIQFGYVLKMMWRGNLLTHNVYYNPHRHTTEAFLALAKAIGADTNDMSPAVVKIYNEDRLRLNSLLLGIGIKEVDRLVLMNINASQLCLERRWPIENFAELTKKMLESGNSKIILIGDNENVPYVSTFLNMIKGDALLINLTGKLDIGMLAALLEKSRLLITNDSGPLHMASSMGTSTVSFFGPESPDRFGPTGAQHTVFYSGIYCSPCLNVYNQKTAPCNGANICMERIPVDKVYNSIMERYLK